MEMYRLFRKVLERDREGIIAILERYYQRGIKSYQRLTNILKRHPSEQSEFIENVQRLRDSEVDILNKILDSDINLRLQK
jgi:hypothetical protein